MSVRTIGAALSEAADNFGRAPWMGFQGEVQTFTDLGRHVNAIAAGLVANDVGRGDRVGLFLGNGFEWLQIEYGTTSLGAWLVPINTMLHEQELEHVVGHSTMSMLIWASEVLRQDTKPLLSALVPELHNGPPGRWRCSAFPELRTVVGIGPGPWPQGVITWESLLESGCSIGAEVTDRTGEVTPEDVALMLYTSGTTGAPKGALIRHRAIVEHIGVWARHLRLGREDRSIMASPLFWSFGCTVNAMVPLLVGSMIVLEERFEAGQFLTDLSGYGCTHLQGVPTQYELALAHPRSADYDLSNIRLVQIGGSSSAEGLVPRLLERMPGARLVSSYGLTEAVGVNTYTELGDSLEDVTRTVGHAAIDNEIELRNLENSDVVPRGAVGEVWIRGPHVMAGYFENPGATADALVDGWLRTGDLAVADGPGDVSIVGREADAYKRGGMNVYPAEAEGVLQEYEGIQQVAVIGIPDETMGQIGIAFVVPQLGAQLQPEDVLAYCRKRLAVYKVPSALQVVSELPLTPTGKVQKFKLRQQWVSR